MLLVFSDDWGRHASSCQHLVRQLLGERRVTWVNTIGMRPPSLNLATVRRAFEKFRHWSGRPAEATAANPNLRVVNPRMWPWFRRPHDRWLNRKLLLKSLRPLVERAGEPVTAITTIPIVADLLGELPVEQWVYYCVDDFSVWPGVDQQAMLAMERKLVERCDRLIAVSETLQDRLAAWGRTSELLTHGVDLEFWRLHLAQHTARNQSPRILFWGVIDRRMDVEWVARLSEDLTQGTIELVGPLADPDPRLLALPRVRHTPPQPLDELPKLAAAADVLVMPYADLPVTRAMQPLKLKEYLATGKPVVVRDLPSTEAWRDALDIAGSAGEFSRLVHERISAGVPQPQLAARERLADESWAAKAQQFLQFIESPSALPHAAAPAVALAT
jgi:glycosyltransferase involved in cell wall biosynthesis